VAEDHMTIEQRKKKLAEAQEMVKATMKRIRRLNTSLKNWERREKMHSKALVLELESRINKPRRHISVGEEHESN
jgi:hypothetical protein